MHIKIGQVRGIRYARDRGEYVASFLLDDCPAKLHASQIIPVRNGDWLAMEGKVRDGVFAGRYAHNKSTGAISRGDSVDDLVAALVIAALAVAGIGAGLPYIVGLVAPASLSIGLHRWLMPRAILSKLRRVSLPDRAQYLPRAFIRPADHMRVERRLK